MYCATVYYGPSTAIEGGKRNYCTVQTKHPSNVTQLLTLKPVYLKSIIHILNASLHLKINHVSKVYLTSRLIVTVTGFPVWASILIGSGVSIIYTTIVSIKRQCRTICSTVYSKR